MIPVSFIAALPARHALWNRTPTWPQSPVRSQFASDMARAVIQQNGLDHIDRVFELTESSIHSHKGRAVSPVTLYNNGKRIEAFVKMNWGRRRLVPRMTQIKTGQMFYNFPTLEWQGIRRLESLGLLVPKRWALIQSGRLWFREAVIIQRVPPEDSVDDLIRSGQWNALTQENQRAILEGMVDVMQSIHQAGLGWRGTCTRHFFPEHSAHDTWKLWLIDCEGIHPHLTQPAINRDYRKLHRALEISGANLRTLQWFRKLVDRAKQTPKPPKPRQPQQGLLLNLQPST